MEKQAYFPMFLSLEGKKAVVIGGGSVASRRIETLLQFTHRVTVVTPRLLESMEHYVEEGRIELFRRPFEKEDIQGAFLVVAATDSPEINDFAAGLCKRAGIWINHAGDKNLCDFYFPGIVKDGRTVIGITASGDDHGLAKRLTEFIREKYREFTGGGK